MGSLHGRRRVRPGDERRDRHRQGHRHDLPRRPAAREGRDRRGRHGRGARRRRGPHPPLRASPTTRRSTTSTRSRSAGRSSPTSTASRRRRPGIAATRSRPAVDPAGHLRRGLGRPAPARAGPRDHRPARRRLAVPRVQAALRRDAGDRLRPPRRLPGRRSSPTTGSCSASRRSRAPTSSSSPASAGSRSSSSRTSPGSWSGASTRRPASPRTARSS